MRVPISFLEQRNSAAQAAAGDARLKARQLVRELAAHRYGVFKESGFRYDYMYPPFSALAGANAASLNRSELAAPAQPIRGFDERWQTCEFDAQRASGLPAPHAINCAPYQTGTTTQPVSFNMMSADPISYAELGARKQPMPLEWARDGLADGGAKWHFCGDSSNFFATTSDTAANNSTQQQQQQYFAHNQLASNKQNVMCNERSALDVIRSHDDFRRAPSR